APAELPRGATAPEGSMTMKVGGGALSGTGVFVARMVTADPLALLGICAKLKGTGAATWAAAGVELGIAVGATRTAVLSDAGSGVNPPPAGAPTNGEPVGSVARPLSAWTASTSPSVAVAVAVGSDAVAGAAVALTMGAA